MQVDASWHCCCCKTKENIYINKHSDSLEELTVFTLLDTSATNTYLSEQILDEILKKKESYKLHCQVGAISKFNCCRPMDILYVDLYIVSHPDSAILIFHRCH